MNTIKDVYDFFWYMPRHLIWQLPRANSPVFAPMVLNCSMKGKYTLWYLVRPNVTHQIAVNSKIEICVFKGKTLRIECKLVEDNRPEVGNALVDTMSTLKPRLGENGENGVMYYLADATASFLKMMELEENRTF